MLWFDASRRWHRQPGHLHVRVTGGRVLILETGLLRATDVYTGRKLWEVALPVGLQSITDPLDRHAIHRRPSRPRSLSATTELVAVEDAIYLSDGTSCLVLDPATGEPGGRIDLPEDLEEPWANLRVTGDYLVGSSGRHVLCMDRRAGKLLWRVDAARTSLYLAVGGNKVFCSELANPQRGEDETRDGSIFALDLATGKRLWERPGGSRLRYSPSLDLVVTTGGFFRGSDGEPVPRQPDLPQTQLLVTGGGLPKTGLPGLIAGRKLLAGSDETLRVYELPTTELIGDPLKWVRRGCTGTRASTNLMTTRYRSNSAWIDLDSREITPFLGIRPACATNNNLYPANGVLNMPGLTGGCTCNFAPASVACVPAGIVERGGTE